MSEDYKNGFRDGFIEGFKALKDNPYMTTPSVPVDQPFNKSCPQCGRFFVDSLGRPVPMGLVCAYIGCPQGVNSINVSSTSI
jgi:hypothetical protein